MQYLGKYRPGVINTFFRELVTLEKNSEGQSRMKGITMAQ